MNLNVGDADMKNILGYLNQNEWIYSLNIGNIMQIWAAGHFASTPHRVINRSGEERYSIPLFVNPDHTALISPIRGPQAGSSGTDYVTYQRSIWARTFPIAGIAL